MCVKSLSVGILGGLWQLAAPPFPVLSTWAEWYSTDVIAPLTLVARFASCTPPHRSALQTVHLTLLPAYPYPVTTLPPYLYQSIIQAATPAARPPLRSFCLRAWTRRRSVRRCWPPGWCTPTSCWYVPYWARGQSTTGGTCKAQEHCLRRQGLTVALVPAHEERVR